MAKQPVRAARRSSERQAERSLRKEVMGTWMAGGAAETDW